MNNKKVEQEFIDGIKKALPKRIKLPFGWICYSIKPNPGHNNETFIANSDLGAGFGDTQEEALARALLLGIFELMPKDWILHEVIDRYNAKKVE